MKMLALPEANSELGLTPIVFTGAAQPIRRALEVAGCAFFEKFERQEGNREKTASDDETGVVDSSKANIEDEEGSSSPQDAYWSAKHKDRGKSSGSGQTSGSQLRKLLEGPNLYAVLGILDECCSMEVIRNCYRRLALKYHPDKRRTTSGALAGSHSEPNLVATEAQHRQTEESEGAPVPGYLSACEPGTPTEIPSTPTVVEKKPLDRKSSKDSFSDIFSRSQTILQPCDEATRFHLLQTAYETLADPRSREQYDNLLPFDESMPSTADVVAEEPESFFSAFGPVFERNARWSAKRRIPILGTMSTPLRDVKLFYSGWRAFQTTRSFCIHDEFDLADAECREERRWMERQNAKTRRKYIRDENLRIAKLTELAYSLDPRIRASKELERKRKEEAKESKRREAEARALKQRAEEAERQLEEEKKNEELKRQRQAEAEAKQRSKAALKQARQRLRLLCRDAVESSVLSAELVQNGCLELGTDMLNTLCDRLESEGVPSSASPEVAREIREALATRDRERNAEAAAAAAKQKFPASTQSKDHQSVTSVNALTSSKSTTTKEDQWLPEELSLLARGLQRYPGGTAGRWNLIAASLGTRTTAEVIQMSKKLAEGATLKSMGSVLTRKAFDQFQKDNIGALSKIDCRPDESYAASPLPNNGSAGTTPISTAAPVSPHPASCGGRVAPSVSTTTSSAPPQEPAPDIESSKLKTSNCSWLLHQQRALEKALRTYPGTMPMKERWTAIAAEVPGKTPKECLQRFKELRELLSSESRREVKSADPRNSRA